MSHRLAAQAPGVADVFNDFLKAVEVARQQAAISKSREVGYVGEEQSEGLQAGRWIRDARCAALVSDQMRTQG